MKLCMVANPNSVHVHRWMQHFLDRGDTVHLIGAKPLHTALPDGIVFHDAATFTRIPKIQYAVRALATRRFVRSIKPDILHAHFIDGGGWLGAATGFHPFIVTAYGSDLLVAPKRSWLFRRLAEWVLHSADHAICWSEPLAYAAHELGMCREKISVLHSGVDTTLFHPDPTAAAHVRSMFDLGPGPLVISIRAIRDIYNPLDIARAIPIVLQTVPAAQFVILTYNHDRALLARFQSIVQDAGVTDTVHYVGKLSSDGAVAQLLQAADVAVSVASSDGTPMSVQEAMACGAALVLGDIPAFAGWVRHAEEALLVPLHDPDAIAAAIIRLLTNQACRQRIARAGVAYIQRHAARSVMMRCGEQIYARFAQVPA